MPIAPVRAIVAALCALALAPACGAGRPTAPPACASPGPALLPGTSAGLMNSDSGQTFCLRQGDRLAVELRVPAAASGTRWGEILPDNPDLLVPGANGALALPLGVTGAVFTATGAGVATLSADRCPLSGTCAPPLETWTATVEVTSR